MTRRRCPGCGRETRWDGNPWRPFCSERCKMVDLGKWASEDYRIPGEKIREEDGETEREEDEQAGYGNGTLTEN